MDLVVVHPVLRELDKHKPTHPVRRLKDKASAAVKWLGAMARSSA